MKLDLSNLKFSKNDLRSKIQIPDHIDTKLAHLLGIQVGDGYLKKRVREKRVDYLICYDGHCINELNWYNSVLRELIKDLFNLDTKVRKTKSRTVQICFRSKAIFTFLHQVCGITQSPKTNIKIPNLIFNSGRPVKRYFLRGLADTDFSLTFKKRKKQHYPVIDFQTSGKLLFESTRELLNQLGFRVHSGYRIRKRYVKYNDSYYINISGRDQLEKWIREIGFSSYNHLTRYWVWKRLGYLPPHLDIQQRLKMLGDKKRVRISNPHDAPDQI